MGPGYGFGLDEFQAGTIRTTPATEVWTGKESQLTAARGWRMTLTVVEMTTWQSLALAVVARRPKMKTA